MIQLMNVLILQYIVIMMNLTEEDKKIGQADDSDFIDFIEKVISR